MGGPVLRGTSGVVRALLLAAALAGCYEEPTTTCTIHCTPSDPNSCPGDLKCNAAGLCNTGGATCAAPSIPWSSIGLGARHACGLSLRGDIYCWGDNSVGQLATGMPGDPIGTPTLVSGGPYKTLAVGSEHTCALDDAGAAFCWGQNANGQSRGAGPGISPMPVSVLGSPPPFDHLTAGGSHTCAIGNGQLWCWGDRIFTNNIPASAATMIAMGAIADWTAVAAGYDHVCGISTTLGVLCFGNNDRGQVGDNTNQVRTAPTAVQGLPAGTQPIAVAAGVETSCAIMATSGATEGQLWCWGHNQDGFTIIDNSNSDRYTANQVGTDADWSSITLGDDLACGIRGGTARCWGSADSGNMGNGLWFNDRLYVSQAVVLGPADQIAASGDAREGGHVEVACERFGSQVHCAGDNAYGELAQNTYSRKPTPVEVVPPTGHTWKTLDCGRHHACATTDDDSLLCWGSTTYGAANAGIALGGTVPCQDKEVCDRALPAPLPAPLTRADDVISGDNYSCARDGAVIHCWGIDFHGSLGGDTPTGYSTVAAPASSTWTSLFGGDTAMCGHTAAGDFACWGYVGAIQQDTAMSLGLQNVTGASFGENFGCATTTANARVCWGGNSGGQLGSNDLNQHQTVSTAYSASNIVQVSADAYHACALTTGGTVQCWGSNNYAESGSSNLGQNQQTPVDIKGTNNQGISKCTRVSVGDASSCAVCDGRVLCWGNNYAAELGRGTASTQPTEIADLVKLPTTEMFTDVSLSYAGGCGLSASGRIFCWGDSLHGELGDGTQSRNLPTPIAP